MNKNIKYITISNTDGTGTTSDFNINFNNSIVTNQMSGTSKIKKYLKPLSLSLDLNYFNISEALKNNKFTIESIGSTTVGSPHIITIEDGSYNGASLGDTLLSLLNAKAITWTGGNAILWTGTGFNGQGITFKYVTTAPSGTPGLKINCRYNDGTNQYDTRKIFGMITDAPSIPYTTKTKISDIPIDLIQYNTLYLRSNVAKSFYKMNGGILCNTDILLILEVTSNLGGTLVWSNDNNEYEQEILENFSNMNFRITDKAGDLVPFSSLSEMNFTFKIETEEIPLTVENRQKGNIDNLGFN